MAEASLTYTLLNQGIDRLLVMVPGETRDLVNQAAINIQARATANTRRRDTGAMANGWQVKLMGGGDLGGSGSTLNPGAGTVEIPDGGVDTAVVGNVMEYAFYWEMGHLSFAPEPMLGEAVEAERRPFEQAFGDMFRRVMG